MNNRELFENIQQLAAICAAGDRPDPAALAQLISCIRPLKDLLPLEAATNQQMREEQIRELERRQDELESEVSDMEDEIADLEMAIMDHEAEEPLNPDGLHYSEWEDRTAELQDTMDDLEAELDDLQSQLDEVTARLDELRG